MDTRRQKAEAVARKYMAVDAWWERVRDNFGADFEIARDVFFALQRDTGIYYYDLAPRNLRFRQ
jgi:hypothetical protein